MYLSYDDFERLFIRGKREVPLGEGSYGKVLAYGDSAVKIINVTNRDNSIDVYSFFREINYYMIINHPNIAKLKGWTYQVKSNVITMKFAISLGISVQIAFETGLVSLEQIMTDMISAISFLHKNYISNMDVKFQNMIFYRDTPDSPGRVKMIDFGLATDAVVFGNDRSYVKGDAYTPTFRHPEYYSANWNPIEVEYYALAKSLYDLTVTDKYSMEWFLSFRVGIPVVDQFIEQAVKTYDLLKPSSDFIELAFGPVNTGVVKYRYPSSIARPFCNVTDTEAIKYMIENAISYDMSLRQFFLALQLYHRVISTEFTENKKIIAQACLYISSMDEIHKFKFSNWKILTVVSLEILKYLNGVVFTPTYWDTATNTEELKILMDNALQCIYDFKTFPTSKDGSQNKDIRMKFFIENYYTFERINDILGENRREIWVQVPLFLRYPLSILALKTPKLGVEANSRVVNSLLRKTKYGEEIYPIFRHRREIREYYKTPGDLLRFLFEIKTQGGLELAPFFFNFNIVNFVKLWNTDAYSTFILRSDLMRISCSEIERSMADVCDFTNYFPLPSLQSRFITRGKIPIIDWPQLDSSYPSIFTIEDATFISVDHMYYSYMYGGDERIVFAQTAGEIEDAVSEMKSVDPNWPEERDIVMQNAVFAKFEQNPHLMELLLKTRGYELDYGMWNPYLDQVRN